MKTPSPDSSGSSNPPTSACADRGLVPFGWWSLLVFLSAGLGLEALHGLKVGWYLDVGAETRRLMLTLGHAHGTLLSLVTIAAGLGARLARPILPGKGTVTCLKAANVLLPLGFWAGAVGVRGGDPGLGIVLVPLGGLLLLAGVFGMGRAARR